VDPVSDARTEREEAVFRWFDHNGNVISAPAAEGRPTAYRWDDQRTHAMLGTPSETPVMQALTLCGKRALEVPGRGEVDCPECIEVLRG
jgi:hypothetical protein